MACFRFCKIVLVCKLMKLMLNLLTSVFCDEINNELFNGFVLYFVNFITEF
jgi:hypothetical protein